MQNEKDIICTVCPRGCIVHAVVIGDEVSVTGNFCPRGSVYTKNECISPMRMVTGLVRIKGKEQMLSVKTSKPISKDCIMDLMEKISSITLDAPICVGDIIIQNYLGCDVIATKNIK